MKLRAPRISDPNVWLEGEHRDCGVSPDGLQWLSQFQFEGMRAFGVATVVHHAENQAQDRFQQECAALRAMDIDLAQVQFLDAVAGSPVLQFGAPLPHDTLSIGA